MMGIIKKIPGLWPAAQWLTSEHPVRQDYGRILAGTLTNTTRNA